MSYRGDNQEALELIELIQGTIESYSKKEKSLTDDAWIKNELRNNNLEIDEKEIEVFSKEVLETIELNNRNIESIGTAIENGVSKEAWFQQKVQEASVGMSVNQVGQYLQGIDNAINNANDLMSQVILNNDGTINRNINLDHGC
ncbi:hypothetical protein HPJ99_11090 [Anoxybacillus flavithermus]|uniref:hypothetical protein n=1 Tax=Anoxybacillus flavithermus TaxID=33934 RepID=UPI0018674997|nr:hypothetical protein [Anoxybacillus flavithermus]MBE2935728.1 hypothetical protein [Anoxybacillus flavithermus]